MTTRELIEILESWAPPSYQEPYDNSGLIVGETSKEIINVLISLDCTEAVIEEAIAANCQMVIAHHPILFSAIKRLNGSTYVERTILKAVQNDISIYAIHTNLDNVPSGVNAMIAAKIGLKNTKILSPKKHILKKLVTYIPPIDFEKLTDAIYKAGGGKIGEYSHCGFSIEGKGTFQGSEFSNPTIGEKEKLEKVDEIRFETVFPAFLESKIVSTLLKNHSYEEVAYDIFALENDHSTIGAGIIGELEKEVELNEFLESLKMQFNLRSIKYSRTKQKIHKVAICGGSGSFLRFDAIKNGADAFITSDFKYHEWFDHEDKIELIDIGHYESEQFTPILIYDYLKKNALSLQSQISRVDTNPVNYYL